MTIPRPGFFPFFGRRLRVVCGVVGLIAAVAGRAQDPDDSPILLDPLLIEAGFGEEEDYDATGMGGTEAEMSDPPFGNDLIGGYTEPEEIDADLEGQLALAGGASPADLAAGVDRVNLRGFPTPRRRNGFVQNGIPEVLNSEKRGSIRGPLTPVFGRAAPGGIDDFVTARPRGKAFHRMQVAADDQGTRTVKAESNDVVVKKTLWQRVRLGLDERSGPQAFAARDTHDVGVAWTWRLSRATSMLVHLDYQNLEANAPPGVPEFRASREARIAGPYRPLVEFNLNGPEAETNKRTTSASVQIDSQVSRAVSVRANVQAYDRELDQDRWTKGEYLLDVARFGGTREPQHLEQPFEAWAAEVDVTSRFVAAGADHKVTIGLESTRTDYTRTQRQLERAERDAILPVTVRQFDPAAPDYFQPDYSEALFSRLVTDRTETTDYRSVVVSERTALAGGRFVGTAGVRYDDVDLLVEDRRANASRPRAERSALELTWHAGGNWVVRPGRLLAFANYSTAFEPSVRVDARTGRIQGNETTGGWEVGVKGRAIEGKVDFTAMAFTYTNDNIARRNPLYEDPIADADQTQPQLVAAGRERFEGGTLRVDANPGRGWQFSLRGTALQARTEISPDLPEEEGRQLTRVPPYTAGLSGRYRVEDGAWAGLGGGASFTYVGPSVWSYESETREDVEFSGYGLVNVNLNYAWRQTTRRHTVGLTVRNVLDRDMVAALARPGLERQFGVSYLMIF